MQKRLAVATGDVKNTQNKQIIRQRKADKKGLQDKEYETTLIKALKQYYDTVLKDSLRHHGNRLRLL